MDFDFRSFSTRSFERFAQSLTAHVIGPGLLVFGDGPDGGREATYDGTLDFPSPADRWSGYTVMQAKFLQVPKDPSEDANWLVEQMKAELDKFKGPSSSLRKPQYYVLITNARLSPVPSSKRASGGIEKIDKVFRSYKRALGLKDYRVWHLDQIATYLASADGLRRSYSAWLSSSDVIADLLSQITSKKHALSEAMYRYLARELRSFQPLRLQQAGHAGDIATMIEDVFTDLPFENVSDPLSVEESLLLDSLLNRTKDCLDQASVRAQPVDSFGRPERILILGGPGQGKSTATQYMGQILRANILRTDRIGKYPAEVAKIVESTLTKASEIGLPADLPRRFPFRIDLPSFADKLSSDIVLPEVRSLLEYICHEIASISSSSIQIEDVREWIVNYPSVLILDGLDEVPPSANRSAVIRAISEFWDEAVQCDLLMIVTTRPQGYNDDLDPNLYTKLEMTALSVDQALGYATKLAHNRLSDSNQRDRVISRMREAARSATTARLMVSPLQVAILLALIDQRGDAPSDRWSLFDKYFMVVLEREQGKAGAVGETMRHWSRAIISLHHKAGFLLHVEAELRGNSEAYLTYHNLKDLIIGQLSNEEFEGEELESVSSELMTASTERLVLLVHRQENRFSFEVRSLQEFMAAAYIMTGRESLVQSRLYAIANRNHWLHVFQIAASKCFAVTDSEHLRDTIVTICRALNEANSEIDRFVRMGSRLALALLDDGLAYDQPKYRRMFLSLALEQILAGPDLVPQSLTNHCHREPVRATEFLKLHLDSQVEKSKDAAWLLMLRAANAGQDWAHDLLLSVDNNRLSDRARIIILSREFTQQHLVYRKLRSILNVTPLHALLAFLVEYETESREERQHLARLYPCLSLLSERGELEVRFKIGAETPFSCKLVSISISKRRKLVYDDLPSTEEWLPYSELVYFHTNATAQNLAELLKKIRDNRWLDYFTDIVFALPWPLANALWLVDRGANINNVIRDIEAGRFGDIASWVMAEVRWSQSGISSVDLEFWKSGSFFDSNVAKVGAPWGSLTLSHGLDDKRWIDVLFEAAEVTSGEPGKYLRKILAFGCRFYAPDTTLSVSRALLLLNCDTLQRNSERIGPDLLVDWPVSLLLHSDVIRSLAQWCGEQGVFLGTSSGENYEKLFSALTSQLYAYPELIAVMGSILSAEAEVIDISSVPAALLEEMKSHEIKVVEGYARIILMMKGAVTGVDVSRIFNCPIDDLFPIELLRRIIINDEVDSSIRLPMCEAVAEYLNSNSAHRAYPFASAIRAVADERRSALHETGCWNDLELGAMLLTLLQQRAR